MSALELQRKLGIPRYETAFQILHKLRSVMVRPDRDQIGAEWPVEMDITFVGGKHQGGVQGKTGKTPVIIAVEVRRRKVRDPSSGRVTQRALVGRVRLQLLPNKTAGSVNQFVQACIAPGATVISDDGSEFADLLVYGYKHRLLTMGKDRAKMDAWLPMVSTVTGNLKIWLSGTFHGVQKKHLQNYLDEFTFRFNRRFYRSSSFRTLLGLGTLHTSPTYRDVYARNNAHRGTEKSDDAINYGSTG